MIENIIYKKLSCIDSSRHTIAAHNETALVEINGSTKEQCAAHNETGKFS